MALIEPSATTEIAQRASLPSVVESFRIEGLYGYRTVSLSSEFAATILIAANGSGKTTLLAALDAFLRGHFARLRDVEFTRICCRLRDIDEDLVLRREDILSLVEFKGESQILAEARKIALTPATLFEFLINDYPEIRNDQRQLMENETFAAIFRRSSYSSPEARQLCENLRNGILNSVPTIARIVSALEHVLRDVEIIYLPTYRRIELSMTPAADPQAPRKRPGFKVANSGLYPGNIQFGLSDIPERLAEMNQDILINSNQGYREISATIITELLDGTFESKEFKEDAIPDKEELELFFSRLKEGRRVRPFMDFSPPNLEKLYSGEETYNTQTSTNKFLRYFLVKLNNVIRTTRDIEKQVNDFIAICNSYLSTREPSTDAPGGRALLSPDDKILRVNRKDLKVHAESIVTHRKIELDALSSGEKQMISLFARLFLYPKEKLLLIDEPELSLSMDWQKKILADAIVAPLCRQVIAITHSPFIFENALEPFAQPLGIEIDTRGSAVVDEE